MFISELCENFSEFVIQIIAKHNNMGHLRKLFGSFSGKSNFECLDYALHLAQNVVGDNRLILHLFQTTTKCYHHLVYVTYPQSLKVWAFGAYHVLDTTTSTQRNMSLIES